MIEAASGIGSQARAVAILCMLLAGGSGIASVSGALELSDRSAQKLEPLPEGTPAADLVVRFSEAMLRARGRDRQARSALLIVLAVSLWFTFVAAGRVLRPGGLPREGIRRLLGSSALVSAGLRAVDGAADAAFFLRVSRMAQQLGPPAGPEASVEWLLRPTFLVGMSLLRTLLVAGALAIIAQYFRSARVKAWAALEDRVPR